MKLLLTLFTLIFLTQITACSGGDQPEIKQSEPPAPPPEGEYWSINGVEDVTGVWLGQVDITKDLEEYFNTQLNQTVMGEYYVTINETGEARDYIYIGNLPYINRNCYIVVEQQFALVHIESNIFIIDGWEGRVAVSRTDTEMFINAENGLNYHWTLSNKTPEELQSQICENLPSMFTAPYIMPVETVID
ncbi:hypothetical protein TDB9533_03580 [Thalassocella blandensis]|nr:hypothetical protein TDB9533_03580 [Thalassocella blandensis]